MKENILERITRLEKQPEEKMDTLERTIIHLQTRIERLEDIIEKMGFYIP